MATQNQAFAIAIVALVIAIIVGGMVFMAPKQESIAGISYDPSRQPTVLPLKEPMAGSAEVASGIFFDGQQINATNTVLSPTVGQVVTLSGSTWVVLNPTSSPGSKIGMVVKAPTTNVSRNGQVLIEGLVYKSGWSMTKGTQYYADDITPGAISVNKNASYVVPVGYAYNTSVFFFKPTVNATAMGL